jgi:hypothetical protein
MALFWNWNSITSVNRAQNWCFWIALLFFFLVLVFEMASHIFSTRKDGLVEVRDIKATEVAYEKDQNNQTKMKELTLQISTADERAALANEHTASMQNKLELLRRGWSIDVASVFNATKGFPLQTLDVMVCMGSGAEGPKNMASNLYRGMNRTYYGADPKWSVRLWWVDFSDAPFVGIHVQVGSSADKSTKSAAEALSKAMRKAGASNADTVEEFNESNPPVASNIATGRIIPGRIYPMGQEGMWNANDAAKIRIIIGSFPVDFSSP